MNQKEICCTSETMQEKLKVLAIHGYRQNAEAFKQKTGSFHKMLHKWAQFTYITAPHKVLKVTDINDVEDINLGQSHDDEQYGWFFNRDDKTFRGIRKGGPAIGFEDSLNLIEDIFAKEGPFDGIFGFSQGGCFVALLCDLLHRGLLKYKFNFAVIVSGFKSGSLPHMKYFNDNITIPTLHVFGENDEIIPTAMSEALSEGFQDPVIVRHSGGHYVPASAPQKHEYQKFFKQRQLEKMHANDSVDSSLLDVSEIIYN